MMDVNIFFVILGALVCGLYFYKSKYKNYTFIYTLLLIPLLYFSINMIDEAMTADETGYINTFIHMDQMERGTISWVKGTYQYRISEIFSGTICFLFNRLFTISDNQLVLIYKYTHWILYFGVTFLIAQIWKKIFDYDVNSIKYRMSNAAVLMILIGAPIACLLLKVCNYDAGCVYFGIAGLSLLILAAKKNAPKIAFAGALVALLSCLEKCIGLPYWAVCATAAGALTYKTTKSVKKTILADLAVLGSSYTLCYLSLIYIRLIQGSGIVDLNIGAALFPLYFIAWDFLATSTAQIDFTILNSNTDIACQYIAFMAISVILFSFILAVGEHIYNKYHTSRKCRIIFGLFSIAIIIGGIVVSFVLTRSLYPCKDFPENVYVPKARMVGGIYFFNTQTKWGYLLATMFDAVSVVLTNQPTAYLLIFLFACVIMMKSKQIYDEYYLFLIEIFVLLLPSAYTLSGAPRAPRYFGVSILMLPILSVYMIGRYMYEDGRVKSIMVQRFSGVLLYISILVEMILYIPNYVCFSPLWLYRNEEFRTTVRQGEWENGEAMMWGEDFAIAGNKVMELIGPQDDYGQYTLYYSYGSLWLKNPGFNRISMYSGLDNLSWTDKDYYLFTKFMIYRKTPPEFLRLVTPDAVISYKGEIAVWIYRGDKIKDYSAWFES